MRKYQTQNAAEKLLNAFITLRLDYNVTHPCMGYHHYLLKKLQKLQNMALKILAVRRNYEHITPIPQEFHWLPVENRIFTALY